MTEILQPPGVVKTSPTLRVWIIMSVRHYCPIEVMASVRDLHCPAGPAEIRVPHVYTHSCMAVQGLNRAE